MAESSGRSEEFVGAGVVEDLHFLRLGLGGAEADVESMGGGSHFVDAGAVVGFASEDTSEGEFGVVGVGGDFFPGGEGTFIEDGFEASVAIAGSDGEG